ncbi:MAG: translation elongation factor Ts [Acidobacteria bacterium]|nr:translation elongation factor Ts [Acidobacteriota bacterium]
MAEVTAQLVKQLRERTGAGMMECKKALDSTSGDLEKAIDELRKRGAASADKKASRSALQGSVGTLIAGDVAVIVEINCESDFVARTDDFQALVASVAAQVAESDPADVAALGALPYSGDPSVSVLEAVKQKIAKLGENMVIARFGRLTSSGSTAFGSYIHAGSQLGVLLEVEAATAAGAANPEVQELVKDLAMQVAAADPKFVRREEVGADVLERERGIARDRAKNENKPEKIWDRIIDGRIEKFYEEVCLLEQPFIKENSVSITELVKQKSAKVGEPLTVTRFVRFKVGETAVAGTAE